jgi:hypothetical protein
MRTHTLRSFSPHTRAHTPDWVFLDFTLRNVNIESTRLFSIKRKIKQRHGRISNLRIYLGTMQPQTELKDEMMTLEELGIEGLPLVRPSSPASAVAAASKQTGRGDGISDDDGISPGVQGVKNITLWYDFKPFAHEDPLLLR